MSASGTPAQQSRELRESLRLARDLSDALVAQAERVRAQCEQLEEALKNFDLLEAAPLPADPDTEPPAARDREEPARLAAMEMALQGRTREEILDYLRRSMDDAHAQQVIAAVFDRNALRRPWRCGGSARPGSWPRPGASPGSRRRP